MSAARLVVTGPHRTGFERISGLEARVLLVLGARALIGALRG